MGRPKLFNKSLRTTIVLDARVSAAYNKIAAAQGTTASDLMRKALLNHLRALVRAGKAPAATANVVNQLE